METFGVDRSIYDIAESDLKEIWDTNFDSPMQDLPPDGDWTHLLDNQPIILNDRMITDAMQSPRIQSEHSYSLVTSEEGGEQFIHKYMEADLDSDCYPTIPMSSGSSTSSNESYIKQEPMYIKQEPMSNPGSPIDPGTDSPPPMAINHHHRPTCQQSLLKHTTSTTDHRHFNTHSRNVQSKPSLKVEPGFSLPPTPPSSHGSDSEGSSSPVHSQPPPSPVGLGSPMLSQALATPAAYVRRSSSGRSVLTSAHVTSRTGSTSPSSLISSQPVKKGATGVLMLTEEEKRTLVAEGYPVPTRLPLSKAEEKSLKKIRRKIKNKISAQESRRKKKEYMDTLERKCEILANENVDNKRKMDNIENNNKNLLIQLQQLQAILGEVPARNYRTVSTQTTSCLMPKKGGVARLGKS